MTDVYWAEATTPSGNTVTHKTMDVLKKQNSQKSGFFDKNATNYLIKMDNVYNYYSDTLHITTESEKNDCADGTKSGGNCYKYSESYNDAFNQAIVRKQ